MNLGLNKIRWTKRQEPTIYRPWHTSLPNPTHFTTKLYSKMHFKLLFSATLAGVAIANPDADTSDDYDDVDVQDSNPIAARAAAPVNPESVLYYAWGHAFPSAENMVSSTGLSLKHPSTMDWKPELTVPLNEPVKHHRGHGKILKPNKHGHVSSLLPRSK